MPHGLNFCLYRIVRTELNLCHVLNYRYIWFPFDVNNISLLTKGLVYRERILQQCNELITVASMYSSMQLQHTTKYIGGLYIRQPTIM